MFSETAPLVRVGTTIILKPVQAIRHKREYGISRAVYLNVLQLAGFKAADLANVFSLE